MADPEILYRGGELDSLTLISGAAGVSTSSAYRDAEYSSCAVALRGNVLGENFSSPVQGGDDLWGMAFCGLEGLGAGQLLIVYDDDDRPAFRLRLESGGDFWTLQQNTSPNATASWSALGTTSSVTGYIVFRIKTGSDNNFSLYANDSLSAEGTFSNNLIGPLSYFRSGSFSGLASSNHYISQIQFSRNIPLVKARVLTRKASAPGTYQQMTGAFGNLVKTAINDATGVVSDTAAQITTNQYQDATVAAGWKMSGDVWIWNRAANDGVAPTSIKQACIVNGVLQKGPDMPVDVGFQGLPHVLTGMTPTLWNGCEVGMESSEP